MKIVYDERFGEISFKQRAVYRKFNVAPYDHDTIVRRYGNDHDKAVRHVVENSKRGHYDPCEYRVY